MEEESKLEFREECEFIRQTKWRKAGRQGLPETRCRGAMHKVSLKNSEELVITGVHALQEFMLGNDSDDSGYAGLVMVPLAQQMFMI